MKHKNNENNAEKISQHRPAQTNSQIQSNFGKTWHNSRPIALIRIQYYIRV